MASGKPSIVTGHEESEVKHNFEISDGGFYYFGVDKMDQIIQNIKNLVKNKGVSEKIGKQAREFVIKNYSMESVLGQFQKLIEKY